MSEKVTTTDVQSSIHHLLYEVLMAYGLYVDLHGNPISPRSTEWYRLAAQQESLMMHIRLLHEVFLVKPSKMDFHTVDLIDESLWTEFLHSRRNAIKHLLMTSEEKKTLMPSWSLYSGRVAHLARRREKGHEAPAADFLGDLKFLLPYVERYLDAAKTHLLSDNIELVLAPFEKWFVDVRKKDPHDGILLGVCFDTIARFKALAKV